MLAREGLERVRLLQRERHLQHVLGGVRARDGAAYVVFLSARQGGGTDIDLVANKGA